MSRTGVDSIDSKKKHEKHLSNVEKKRDVLYRKELLLSIWEEIDAKEFKPSLHQYVLGLRARVRALRSQLQAMRPISDDEIS